MSWMRYLLFVLLAQSALLVAMKQQTKKLVNQREAATLLAVLNKEVSEAARSRDCVQSIRFVIPSAENSESNEFVKDESNNSRQELSEITVNLEKTPTKKYDAYNIRKEAFPVNHYGNRWPNQKDEAWFGLNYEDCEIKYRDWKIDFFGGERVKKSIDCIWPSPHHHAAIQLINYIVLFADLEVRKCEIEKRAENYNSWREKAKELKTMLDTLRPLEAEQEKLNTERRNKADNARRAKKRLLNNESDWWFFGSKLSLLIVPSLCIYQYMSRSFSRAKFMLLLGASLVIPWFLYKKSVSKADEADNTPLIFDAMPKELRKIKKQVDLLSRQKVELDKVYYPLKETCEKEKNQRQQDLNLQKIKDEYWKTKDGHLQMSKNAQKKSEEYLRRQGRMPYDGKPWHEPDDVHINKKTFLSWFEKSGLTLYDLLIMDDRIRIIDDSIEYKLST